MLRALERIEAELGMKPLPRHATTDARVERIVAEIRRLKVAAIETKIKAIESEKSAQTTKKTAKDAQPRVQGRKHGKGKPQNASVQPDSVE